MENNNTTEDVQNGTQEGAQVVLMDYQPMPNEYAAIYARKSTKMESYSLETQASLARKLIEEKGLFVYDVYEDEESATKYHPMHRSGFKRLLYDAMQEKFKTVVVFRRDRLARKIEDLIEIKNFFKKQNIKIIYSNQGEFQPDEDSYISSFIENIIMSIDELEPGILRERIAAGKEQKRLRGEYSGKEPSGYKKIINEEEKKIIVPSNEAPIIKNIFDTFIISSTDNFDMFVSEIANHYKDLKLNKKRILDILLRPLYGGLITVNAKQDPYKTIVKDETGMYKVNTELYRKCTDLQNSIISAEVWYACVIKLSKMVPKVDTIEEEEDNYLFKNLIKCKSCKETLYLSNKSYKCLNGCICVEEDNFEDTLLKQIISQVIADKYISNYQEKIISELETKIDISESKIQAFKAAQDKILKNLIRNYIPKTTTDYTLINKLIKDEKAEYEKISIKKQVAAEKKIAIQKLKEILKLRNHSIIIAALRRRTEVTQQLLKGIIKNITIDTIEVNANGKFEFEIIFAGK